jgi:hypothetical protein
MNTGEDYRFLLINSCSNPFPRSGALKNWHVIPTGVLKITKKEKKREEKFSKIFDDISSDIMAGFL